MVVAVATALVPLWAAAGNQEVAEQIGASLRSSGQLHGYKIGVKFQDGTAWLRGSVADRAQMDAALKIVSQTPGVKNMVNNMTIAGERQESVGALQQANGAMAPEASKPRITAEMAVPQATAANNRAFTAGNPATGRAEPVATSFTPSPVQPAGVEEPATTGVDMAPQPPQTSTRFTGMAQPQTQARPVLPTSVSRGATGGMQPLPVAMVQAPLPPAGAVPGSTPAVGTMPSGMVPGVPGAVPGMGGPIPQYAAPSMMGAPMPHSDQPYMPNYAWPGYAAYPNYAALTYPKQYSPTAWPYIGPFYPYPQVPLGWRKVTMEWRDGWWFLDFDDGSHKGPLSGAFRPLSWRW
jgi:hypothetical protein